MLDHYHYEDFARKVVGVGSVGTEAFMILLMGDREDDPLFLQVKEANTSVLAPYAGASEYEHQGERVVQGQRITQAASDAFLGWVTGTGERRREFYVRQLRDMKGSAAIETMPPAAPGHATASSAGRRSRAPTPAPATPRRSPATSATTTRSTARSSSSPSPTPTRTTPTMRRSPTPPTSSSSPSNAASEPGSEVLTRMSVLWTLVILLAVNAVAISAMLLVRRGAPEGSRFKDGDRASGVFGVLAGGFAIFAGFIIFLAFTTYDQSRTGGEAEALTVVQQFETAQFMPPAERNVLSGQLVCYGRSVVHREWPQMEAGEGGDAINPWAVALFTSLKRVQPVTAAEQAAYSKWLDQTSDREAGRRDRLHGAAGIIPASIWLVLLLIAGVVFAFMLFFADSGEGVGAQVMLMASATTVIVLTLAAINALDNPYRDGLGQIKPVAMERSLRILERAQAVTGTRGALPCDARGVAVPS